MVASRLALMPGTVSITATSCRVYGFGFVQPSPGLSKGSHCQGVPVQASVPVDGEQKPSNAQLVGSGIPQERSADGGPSATHPAFEPHPIQGWTPDFIPRVLQEAIDTGGYDALIAVPGAEGMAWARRLAAEEGICAGISAGATLAVAMKIAETAPEGSVLLAMLPDTGERYLSTPLFEPFGADMNAEELEISKSTPGHQLD